MIRLTATTEKLQAVLSGSVATTQPKVIVCYSDETATGYGGGKQISTLNSTTDIDICAAPAASTIRDIDYISIINLDTAAIILTVKYDISSTDSQIVKATLDAGDHLIYTHSDGWSAITSTGSAKGSGATPPGGTPAGSSGDIQYNNSGAFGAEAAFNYNSTTNTLLIDNVTIGVAATVPTPSENDDDTSVASTAFVNANISGCYRVVGNRSLNNSTTPNTQFDLVADAVTLRNTNNHIVTKYAPSTLTNNVLTAGSTAGGRDQAGTFSASSWIYFYWIWNGTTLSSLSSATGPTTGPTLPSGYTHWCYCTAVYYDSSSFLRRIRMTNNYASYLIEDGSQNLVSAGVATTFTAFTTSAYVPPNCLGRYIPVLAMTDTVPQGRNVLFRPTGSGMTNGVLVALCTTQINSALNSVGNTVDFPGGTSGQIDYKLSSAPTSGGVYIQIFGYTILS